MNWTDIEAKWVAMTRRVQADQSPEMTDLASTPAPSLTLPLRDEKTAPNTVASIDRSAT